MEMKMEVPSSDGAGQWLSELGMEDSTLLNQLDSLFSPAAGQLTSIMGYQSSNNVGLATSLAGFQPKDSQRESIFGASTNNFCYKPMEASVCYERPSKIPKLSTWDISFGQQKHGNSAPMLQSSFYSQDSHQFLASQQQLQHQPSFSHQLEGFLASLPRLGDETYETVAPRTPTIQFEMGSSQGSIGQESCITDARSIGNAVARETLLSSGQNSEIFPVDIKIQGMAGSGKYPAGPAKTLGHSQDHILAERKRREKLSQRFIALSAILPGLKKMDKASVLADAIKYVKQLQDRLKAVEEQAALKSSISVKKSSPSRKDSNSSPGGKSATEINEVSSEGFEEPEIEVRTNGKNVLIRVHCEKKKGMLVKSLAELEKLQLAVVNASILSFSETTLDLTFSAQMEEGCQLTADHIVEELQSFFKEMK